MKRFGDPFRGNVKKPGEFLFIYILIGLICISCLAAIALNFKPVITSDLQYAKVTFETYGVNPEDQYDLHLYVPGEQMYYELRAYERVLANPELFMERCGDGEIFEVGFTTAEKADPPFHILYSIVGGDDTIYLSHEAANHYNAIGIAGMYLLFGGLTVIWCVFVALSIIVGRHPERFSSGFLRLFFRSGSIKHSAR